MSSIALEVTTEAATTVASLVTRGALSTAAGAAKVGKIVIEEVLSQKDTQSDPEFQLTEAENDWSLIGCTVGESCGTHAGNLTGKCSVVFPEYFGKDSEDPGMDVAEL